MWLPNLDQHAGPRYRAIADALDADVARGALAPGTRLPTHRELAYRLGLTVGTVTRAYAEAERRGLIAGEVGRGTYVRGGAGAGRGLAMPFEVAPGLIDLATNAPAGAARGEELAGALAALAGSGGLDGLAAYQPPAGGPSHRAAGAELIRRRVPGAEASRVVLTGGGQNAIAAVLAWLARPGDTVLAESLSWPGLKALAELFNLKVESVAMDGEGIDPAALEEACRSRDVRLLYCTPTLQNPTAAIMSEARRGEIVEVARRHDLILIEDDVYGMLPESPPPPLATLAPERTYYIIGTSKCLSPVLRTGYVLTPEGEGENVAAGVRATMIMAPALGAEIAARWIGDGTFERLIARERREAVERFGIAEELLAGFDHGARAESFHFFLTLPAPWRAGEFSAAARERGVLVTPADAFAAGRTPAPHGVRVAMGAAPDHASLRRGLETLRELLETRPVPGFAVV